MEKLVRDNIPVISFYEKDGSKFRRVKNEAEFLSFLADKVIEEAYEVAAEIRNNKDPELIVELGDLLSVISAIVDKKQISQQILLEKKDLKDSIKGGFSQGWILMDFKARILNWLKG